MVIAAFSGISKFIKYIYESPERKRATESAMVASATSVSEQSVSMSMTANQQMSAMNERLYNRLEESERRVNVWEKWYKNTIVRRWLETRKSFDPPLHPEIMEEESGDNLG